MNAESNPAHDETAAAPSGDPDVGGGRPPAKRLNRQAKLAIGIVVLAALVALFWPRGDGTFEAPGGFLYDPEGQPTTLGDRMAPVTLLHFWATWCPPCLTEIPSLYRLGAEAPSDQLAILMVAVDDPVEKVESFLGSRAETALYDPSWEVAHRYKTYKLPETHLLVGTRVVDSFIGAQNWDDPALRRRLAEKIREHLPDGPDFGVEVGVGAGTGAGAGR